MRGGAGSKRRVKQVVRHVLHLAQASHPLNGTHSVSNLGAQIPTEPAAQEALGGPECLRRRAEPRPRTRTCPVVAVVVRRRGSEGCGKPRFRLNTAERRSQERMKSPLCPSPDVVTVAQSVE